MIEDNKKVVKQLLKYRPNFDTVLLQAVIDVDDRIRVIPRGARNILDALRKDDKDTIRVELKFFQEEHGMGTFTTPNINWPTVLRKAVIPKPGHDFVSFEARHLELLVAAYILKDHVLLRDTYRNGGDLITAIQHRWPRAGRSELKKIIYESLYQETRPVLFDGLVSFKKRFIAPTMKTVFGTPVTLPTDVADRFRVGFNRLVRTTIHDLTSRAIIQSGELRKLAFSFQDLFVFELKKGAKIGHIIDAFRKPFKTGPELTIRYTIGDNLDQVTKSAFRTSIEQETYL